MANLQVRLTAGNCNIPLQLQCLRAHRKRLSRGWCRQRLWCTWTAGMPRSLFHSYFRVVSISRPLFHNTTTTTINHLRLSPLHTAKFCFPTHPKACVLPVGHGSCMCIVIMLLYSPTQTQTQHPAWSVMPWPLSAQLQLSCTGRQCIVGSYVVFVAK